MDVQTALNNFVATNNNKALDFDHQYGPQCMDEVNYWSTYLGKRAFTGNANNVPGQNHDQWQWVPNTPSGVPPAGSIVCFAANFEDSHLSTGQFGHVDIAITGTTSTFTGLDQNWDNIQRCKEVVHPYDGVLGWLAPLGLAPKPQSYVVEAIRMTNVRMAPSLGAVVTSQLQTGNTFTAVGTVTGDSVTQNGVTSNIWEHSQLGHFVWQPNTKRL